MGFEGANGTLGGIASVDVGGHKLILATPIFFDDTLEFGADFIVEDLKVDFVATSAETLHD